MQHATELILVRHGETDWNRELRFQGQIDVPLNAVGHAQAERVAARLGDEAGIHAVGASDLQRAVQTAAAIRQRSAPQVDADVFQLAGLREQNFGMVDGMRVADIQREHSEAWAQWVRFDADYAFDGAESPRQFHARVMAALHDLALRHPGRKLVVVTHGGVLDMVYRTAHGLALSGPRQAVIPNAGINRVRMAIEQAALRFEIVDWADARHLQDLPAQPVYDQSRLALAAALAVPSAPR
ncbi:phosphoglycerate kinase [Rhodoferax koreense]|uniref:Phosphoglycerate kinase n=1 Tax=Rhodoferax koreensis TaxID=1842727 RepID=A0A1P8K0A6_9BURK|nr:histidine phosphatase family protein [Rhodoferax koreense]APW39371.1 phosphoglycerate kinase [Rhodoferax koreense]